MKALAKGCLLPKPDWTATVMGCSSRALALKHEDNAGISIVASMDDMDARAFALGASFASFSGFVKKGDRLLYDGKSLSSEYGLFVETENAIVWDPRPELVKAGKIKNAKHVIIAMESAIKGQGDNALNEEGISSGAFGKAFKKLVQGAAFPAKLVGFGPGSTPAGDDWLGGYLTAMDARLGQPGGSAAMLRGSIAAELCRTSFSGRSLLLGCLEGCPPAYLARLALAAISGSSAEIAAAVKEALGHGASSGRDAMDGFVFALSKGQIEY